VACARRRKADGIICGHIHHAEMRMIDGILYCNDGDWVESCTALVEHFDGRLELVRWFDQRPSKNGFKKKTEAKVLALVR
jgi:UDP-2,3-diacylglucosamine pyrophosphatase LpxH